jgi:hypothetical protein
LTLAGNALAPGIADRYLARSAFDSQQTEEPVASDRPDNLFTPLPGDRGAHGDFDATAHSRSMQWLLTRHRVAALVAGAAAAFCAAVRRATR